MKDNGHNEHNGLHDLFLSELADMHHAEKQLTKALPKLAKAASNDKLRKAFETHLRETKKQVTRLEQVFKSVGETPKTKRCKGMKGLIDEGTEVLSDHKGMPELDAALIAASQKAEHYEIASYGCLCTWAEMMDHQKALKLLKENLAEEKAADEKLTEIAESLANFQAAGA